VINVITVYTVFVGFQEFWHGPHHGRNIFRELLSLACEDIVRSKGCAVLTVLYDEGVYLLKYCM